MNKIFIEDNAYTWYESNNSPMFIDDDLLQGVETTSALSISSEEGNHSSINDHSLTSGESHSELSVHNQSVSSPTGQTYNYNLEEIGFVPCGNNNFRIKIDGDISEETVIYSEITPDQRIVLQLALQVRKNGGIPTVVTNSTTLGNVLGNEDIMSITYDQSGMQNFLVSRVEVN